MTAHFDERSQCGDKKRYPSRPVEAQSTTRAQPLC